MNNLWTQVLAGILAGVVVLVIGGIFGPPLRRLFSPKARREAEVKREAEKRIQPFTQNVHGNIIRQEIHYHYHAATTAANTAYVTTGQGLPIFPDPKTLYGDPNAPKLPPPTTSSDFVRPPEGFDWEGLNQPKNGATFRPPMNTTNTEEEEKNP